MKYVRDSGKLRLLGITRRRRRLMLSYGAGSLFILLAVLVVVYRHVLGVSYSRFWEQRVQEDMRFALNEYLSSSRVHQEGDIPAEYRNGSIRLTVFRQLDHYVVLWENDHMSHKDSKAYSSFRRTGGRDAFARLITDEGELAYYALTVPVQNDE